MNRNKRINYIHEEDSKIQEIVDSFIQNIFDAAMRKFNLQYSEVSSLLHKLNYWEKLNIPEIALEGARYGVEPIISDMEDYLKNQGEIES